MEDIIRIDKYTVIKVEDNGEYGWKIMEGWITQEGEFKPNFCKRSFKKGSEEKTVPVTVKLGDKETAVNVVRAILERITGNIYVVQDNDTVPF